MPALTGLDSSKVPKESVLSLPKLESRTLTVVQHPQTGQKISFGLFFALL